MDSYDINSFSLASENSNDIINDPQSLFYLFKLRGIKYPFVHGPARKNGTALHNIPCKRNDPLDSDSDDDNGYLNCGFTSIDDILLENRLVNSLNNSI